MGDNRDNSRDSRWPAAAGDAVGFVPLDRLVGRAGGGVVDRWRRRMAQTVDMDFRSTLGPDRGDAVSALEPDARAWLEAQGFAVTNETPWIEALTRASMAQAAGQRLPAANSLATGCWACRWRAGSTAQVRAGRQAVAAAERLVSGATCARIARNIDLPAHIRLGKQARDDGGADSDKILGDVMEALIGACFIENGFDAAQRMVYRLWTRELEGDVGKAKHPKSALQEWAAGNKRAVPHYEVVERSGPDHAARFTVRVSVRNVGEAEASASSKGEAERLAAKAFLEEYGSTGTGANSANVLDMFHVKHCCIWRLMGHD